uniref:ATP synthase F0 subunit 8 n=1 Tax=Meloidogyne hapla TaxID=6305 RepID=A0A1I8B5Y2_MELHA
MSLPSKDPSYLAYENAGVTFEFLMPAFILTIEGFIAILLNFSLCYITIKYR